MHGSDDKIWRIKVAGIYDYGIYDEYKRGVLGTVAPY